MGFFNENGINIKYLMFYLESEGIKRFINTETTEIIDDFDYNKLSLETKRKYIKTPEETVESRLKIAEKYFNEPRNKKYKEILFAKYTNDFSPLPENINEIHSMLEEYRIREDFLKYEEKKEEELVEFCKKTI